MNNFSFQNKTKIIFGKDTLNTLGSEIKSFSNKVLLHYGGESIKKSKLYDTIIKFLKENDIEVFELGGVVPNPRLDLAKKGIDICRKEKIDFILAVGGGSVIDSAKCIAVGVDYDGDVWDFFMKKAVAKSAINIGVVLTIPAAGSESSNSCVITKEDDELKRSYGASFLEPKFAILDPVLTYTLPEYQTICGASDIMAHVMERYFTNVKNVELSDRLCESVLKTIINNIFLVLKTPTDYNSRAEIMWSGTLAHNNLLSCGRTGDWASHDIEHELSAIYDIAHGAGLSIIFPAWMKYVYKHDLDRFVQYAVRVWNVEIDYTNKELTALRGIEKLEEFYKQIGLPTRLSDVNIDNSNLEIMANKAVLFGDLGNFVKLSAKDIYNIYMLAL